MKNKKYQNGFTLIELLLGLSIFVVISLSLYTTFANGIQINRRAHNLENFYRETRWALDTLTVELENMLPFEYQDFFENPHGAFSGETDSVTLLLQGDTGLKIVTYHLVEPDFGQIHQTIINESTEKNVSIVTQSEEESEIRYLVREERPIKSLFKSDLEEFEVEVLSRHVQADSLQFSYAFTDRDRNDNKLFWRDQWTEIYNPAGVRVEIAFINPRSNQEPLQVKKDIIIPTGFWGDIVE